jgi:hypothetical protein
MANRNVEQLQQSLIIGNKTGGNYTETETDGTQVAKGDATCWDDIYVYPEALDANGSNPPVRKQFQNDGQGGTDAAVRFIDNTGAQGNMYTELENATQSGEFTIEFWVKPETSGLQFLFRTSSNCWVRLSNSGSSVRLYYDFGFANFGDQNLNIGAWNHCCLCVSKLFNYVRAWTNGQLSQDSIGTASIVAESIYTIANEGSPTSSLNYEGTMDLLTVYNVVLTDSQVIERYNNGIATENLPSGITDANRVLYIPFNNNSGNTLTNTKGEDATIAGTAGTDFEWVTGAIGITGSFGVYLKAFETGKRQYAGLNISP